MATRQILIPLPAGRSSEFAEQIKSNLVFADAAIEAVRLADDGASLQLDIAETADAQSVHGKVDRLISELSRGYREIKVRRLFSHRGRRRASPPSDDELQALGWIIPLGPGQMGLGGHFPRLVAGLDRFFRDLAVQSGSQEYAYPALLPLETLVKANYLSAFPHQAFFVSHLGEDIDETARFIRQVEANAINFGNLRPPTMVVPPAACYPVYQQLEGASLDPARPLLITTCGRCGRYESRNAATLRRLFSFTLREVVAVGTPAAARELRAGWMQQFQELAVRFDLSCSLETATDPFFVNDAGQRTSFQKLTDVKYELRAELGDESDTLAVSSFNLHGTHFTHAFNIHGTDGSALWTACFGCGLERWAYALVKQHGTDPERWPAPMRSLLEG